MLRLLDKDFKTPTAAMFHEGKLKYPLVELKKRHFQENNRNYQNKPSQNFRTENHNKTEV